jgi:hypothetical protein
VKLPGPRAAITFAVGVILSVLVYRKLSERFEQLPSI